MHIGAAFEHWARRNPRPSAATAGIGVGHSNIHGRRRTCCSLCCSLCPPWGLLLPPDLGGQKVHAWCLLGVLVSSSVICIGMFEATRLSTHVLMSPCTILGSEVIDVGTCTLCDESVPATCEVHPIASARLAVTYQPRHRMSNVTGWVWYCKGRASSDPCQHHLQFLDQLMLDSRQYRNPQPSLAGPVPCTAGEVYGYMHKHIEVGSQRHCYYSSRDPDGEDVWLSMPSPGLVDHAWFQKHLEYPVLLAFGGLVLLSVLLGCLALEGAELWASGLI